MFTGWLGLFGIVAILMFGCIMVGFFQYHLRGVGTFFSNVLSVIGKFFTMPFTAWPTLLATKSLFKFLAIVFAIGVIVYTIKKVFEDEFFLDIPFDQTVLGFVVLEFLHHFWGPLGIIGSLYNGLCLSLPVLIILAIIRKIADR